MHPHRIILHRSQMESLPLYVMRMGQRVELLLFNKAVHPSPSSPVHVVSSSVWTSWCRRCCCRAHVFHKMYPNRSGYAADALADSPIVYESWNMSDGLWLQRHVTIDYHCTKPLLTKPFIYACIDQGLTPIWAVDVVLLSSNIFLKLLDGWKQVLSVELCTVSWRQY